MILINSRVNLKKKERKERERGKDTTSFPRHTTDEVQRKNSLTLFLSRYRLTVFLGGAPTTPMVRPDPMPLPVRLVRPRSLPSCSRFNSGTGSPPLPSLSNLFIRSPCSETGEPTRPTLRSFCDQRPNSLTFEKIFFSQFFFSGQNMCKTTNYNERLKTKSFSLLPFQIVPELRTPT